MTDNEKINWQGWETVGLIGRGSFGDVYEIERKVFDDTEKAALKIISIPQNSKDIEEMYNDGYDEESVTGAFESHLKSILAEYTLMRKMSDCVNIVRCDDVNYEHHEDGIGWNIFIRMELLTPLTKALPVAIPEETVIKLAKDICNALDCCKKYNVIHRDIKPQNIFVSENGDYKLGDFGIAKTVEKTMGGTKIGTYKYMAPEVYNNQPYGTAADIYSLGLVLYWMLNNRRMPFVAANSSKMTVSIEEESRNRRLSGEKLPEPATGSKELKAIVMKACAYNPKDRYSSAREMLDELNELGNDFEDKFKVVLPFEVDNMSKSEEYDAPTEAEITNQDFDAVTETIKSDKNDFDGLDIKEETNKNNRVRTFPMWAKIAIPVVGVVFVVLAILLGAGGFGSNGDLVEVPDVIEKDYYEAIESLESEGLSVDIENCEAVPNIEYENNCVIDQNPSAGSMVRKNTKITLKYVQNELELETGNNGDVSLPDFSLRAKDEVVNFLIENGYDYDVEEINSDVVEKGNVVEYEVSDKKVILYISNGPKAKAMPNVKGKQLEEALNELESLGLVVHCDYFEDNSVEAGTVIEQSINENNDVYSGDEIVLTIATNKPLVKIPAVKGKTASDAKKELIGYGFNVDEIREYNKDVPKGQVIKTYPEAGSSVEGKSIITVYVSEGKQPVKVTYDNEGEKTGDWQYVGDTYKNLPEPQRTGSTFSGWYYNGQPVTSKTVVEVATDHTLTAKWTKGKYTVSFDTQGAGSVNSIAVNYGEAYGNGLPTKLSKTGYVFKGWKDSKGNEIKTTSKVTIAGDHTLTAQWEPIMYTVRYDENGGSGQIADTKHYYDVKKNLTKNNYYITRVGYTFKGWAETRGDSVKYNDGASVVNLTNVNNDTVVLYAVWEKNTYTITFNANGGTVDGNSTKKLSYGSSYGTLPTARKDYNSFDGWYTKKEGGTKVSSTTKMGSANITLYAHWKQNPESDWVTADKVPSGAKTTASSYLYYYYDTKWSSSTSLSGWNKTGKEKWVQTASNTVKCVDSWPTAFKTDHPLYSKYKLSSTYAEYNNSTKRRDVTSKKHVGYIFAHWCSGENKETSVCPNYQKHPHNRYIATLGNITPNQGGYASDGRWCGVFHAIEYNSVNKPEFVENSYFYCVPTICPDSHWWNIEVKVYEISYVEEQKQYEYKSEKKGPYATAPTATEGRVIEKVTVYKYIEK